MSLKWPIVAVVAAAAVALGALGALMTWVVVGQLTLGGANPLSLVHVGRSLIESEIFWTAVGSIGALGGLTFAGRQLFLTRKIEAYKLVCKDEELFDSDQMWTKRGHLARALLQDPSNHKLVDEHVQDVLSFFEDMGFLLRKGIVPIEFVWTSSSGNYYALRYWQVLKPFIDEDRRKEDDPNYYIEFEYLHRRVVEYESKRSGAPTLTPEDLRNFIEEELDITIRIVRKEDLEKLEEVESRSFTLDAFDYKDFEKAYEDQRTWFFVASARNGVIGYILGSVSVDGGKAEIDSLAVEPEYRRCGIGRRLLSHLLARLGSEGVLEVTLQVQTSSTAAMKLYEQAGFGEIETLQEYYTDGSDAYLMKATLPASAG